jgi:hypothetical protein
MSMSTKKNIRNQTAQSFSNAATAALAVEAALAGFWPVTKRPSTTWKSSQIPAERSSVEEAVSSDSY